MLSSANLTIALLIAALFVYVLLRWPWRRKSPAVQTVLGFLEFVLVIAVFAVMVFGSLRNQPAEVRQGVVVITILTSLFEAALIVFTYLVWLAFGGSRRRPIGGGTPASAPRLVKGFGVIVLVTVLLYLVLTLRFAVHLVMWDLDDIRRLGWRAVFERHLPFFAGLGAFLLVVAPLELWWSAHQTREFRKMVEGQVHPTALTGV
jgi:hypothetical protein